MILPLAAKACEKDKRKVAIWNNAEALLLQIFTLWKRLLVIAAMIGKSSIIKSAARKRE